MAKLELEASERDAGGSGPQMPASRHYRKARHDRGAETRHRLLLAALDAFGRYGFEAASTRDIAKRADANLAAIVYHFGSKEALHRAVTEYVIEQITRHMHTEQAEARDYLNGSPDKAGARIMLRKLIRWKVQSMLREEEAELWSRFILREQMDPSSTFDAVYEHLCSDQDPLNGLIGILFDLAPQSDEAIVRSATIMGQIFIFHIGRPMILRRLGRNALGDEELDLIARVVEENIDRIVGFALPLETAA
ncbi:CerR family C-terminal domain-containing protein [Kaistia dalseonensis]|uniref:AcrR family transcriptional regulator n=1 Tax=Kaistia dalseonensis TaxID=410840 RepID=A0ABU0H888_9HYPH|nr:CerR family C-terminal domain-containing protein [Kaistia dalseonensis]MCX5495923.1 CerR family C-terminal domain-containing protein [Kaistia dalseonensis]MDQ0438526.1 AcrR family transcriptional regulator [Kaistia dalseonensis]